MLVSVLNSLNFFSYIAKSSVVTSLGLSLFLREEHQFFEITFQSVDVLLESLSGLVGPSVVDHDSNSFREFRIKPCSSYLLESESSSKSGVGRISLCGFSNNGSEFFERSRENLGSLFLSLLKSSLFLGGLVEEGFDERLPIFSQVGSLNCVVVFGHGSLYYFDLFLKRFNSLILIFV